MVKIDLAMTKKHFIDAANIVRYILNGAWTFEPPSWADETRIDVACGLAEAPTRRKGQV